MKRYLILLLSALCLFNTLICSAQEYPWLLGHWKDNQAYLYSISYANGEYHISQSEGGELVKKGTFSLTEGDNDNLKSLRIEWENGVSDSGIPHFMLDYRTFELDLENQTLNFQQNYRDSDEFAYIAKVGDADVVLDEDGDVPEDYEEWSEYVEADDESVENGDIDIIDDNSAPHDDMEDGVSGELTDSNVNQHENQSSDIFKYIVIGLVGVVSIVLLVFLGIAISRLIKKIKKIKIEKKQQTENVPNGKRTVKQFLNEYVYFKWLLWGLIFCLGFGLINVVEDSIGPLFTSNKVSSRSLVKTGERYILNQMKSPSQSRVIDYTDADKVREALKEYAHYEYSSSREVIAYRVQGPNSFGVMVEDWYYVFFKNGEPLTFLDYNSVNPLTFKSQTLSVLSYFGWHD